VGVLSQYSGVVATPTTSHFLPSSFFITTRNLKMASQKQHQHRDFGRTDTSSVM